MVMQFLNTIILITKSNNNNLKIFHIKVLIQEIGAFPFQLIRW